MLTLRRYNAKILEVADKPEEDADSDDNEDSYYKVQLIDENSEGIDQEDCIKIVGGSKIKYIEESMTWRLSDSLTVIHLIGVIDLHSPRICLESSLENMLPRTPTLALLGLSR